MRELAAAIEKLRGEWKAQSGAELVVTQITGQELLAAKSLDADAAIVASHSLGPLAEGVVGASQWEPERTVESVTGPAPEEFVAAFHKAFGEEPEYPAAQAYAMGIILDKCVEEAGNLDDARLCAAALDLETTTLFGRFRLNQATGRQVGHHGLLVQWVGGEKRVLWPPPDAETPLREFAPVKEDSDEEMDSDLTIA